MKLARWLARAWIAWLYATALAGALVLVPEALAFRLAEEVGWLGPSDTGVLPVQLIVAGVGLAAPWAVLLPVAFWMRER